MPDNRTGYQNLLKHDTKNSTAKSMDMINGQAILAKILATLQWKLVYLAKLVMCKVWLYMDNFASLWIICLCWYQCGDLHSRKNVGFGKLTMYMMCI